jgi:hypothetical protein
MQFAISECHRLGLSFGTHNCPGWSSSAYPSVKPEYAMQKLVWTMVESQGTRRIRLEQPEAAFGYYEDIAAVAVPCDSIVRNEQIIIAPDAATILLPKGRWRVYRFGHTANGKTNGSTSPESGVGLECDKMSREAVAHYWSGYPAMLMSLAGEETGTTFQRLEIDSYEADGQFLSGDERHNTYFRYNGNGEYEKIDWFEHDENDYVLMDYVIDTDGQKVALVSL